jgi:hypothetical protein
MDFNTMDTRHWTFFAIGFMAAGLLTFFACRRWYGRLLLATEQHLQKVDQARLFAVQQSSQARKQVETLQTTLAARPRVSSAGVPASGGPVPSSANPSVSNVAVMNPPPSLDPALAARRRAQALKEAMAFDDDLADTGPGFLQHSGSLMPAPGFADTQIMS